ncbi:alpha/beta fold hydrolase [Flavihumibacter fluvii]|uniref:alpha/beta fold hydrolase n=1 Tax=Flavihumibacter fluvii TaxID=2838157 RepID=UPI001BDEE7E5|nr:alpha/beta hydrolase [Flavihumibacter fluvii]ULQ52483.1 alpha/beta hydrolase [Flavihumibacter fluvii]
MQRLFRVLFCLFALSKLSTAQGPAQKTIPLGTNPAGKMYPIRGFNMYTETYGKGQPLLIIHGNGGSMKDFINQVPYFMNSYKVILADNRAQGRSEDPSDSLSYEQMADDYAELLKAMKIDSAYVIGWSDGGINGLLLAIRHPEKVKKLAVTGANLWPDSTAVYNDVIDLIKPYYDSLMSKNSLNPQERTSKKLMRLLVEQPHITASQLHTIKCPTLVIGGDHDVIREEHTMLIYKNIPKAYLWILPNSGHSTPVIYKDQFNATVADFLKADYRVIDKQNRFN